MRQLPLSSIPIMNNVKGPQSTHLLLSNQPLTTDKTYELDNVAVSKFTWLLYF